MLGAIVILAVAGSLYQNIGANDISRILPDLSRDEVLQLTSGRYSSLFQNLSGEARDQVVQAVTLAIRNGFRILVVGSALALVSSFFLSVSLLLPSFYFEIGIAVADCNLAQEALRLKISRLYGSA